MSDRLAKIIVFFRSFLRDRGRDDTAEGMKVRSTVNADEYKVRGWLCCDECLGSARVPLNLLPASEGCSRCDEADHCEHYYEGRRIKSRSRSKIRRARCGARRGRYSTVPRRTSMAAVK